MYGPAALHVIKQSCACEQSFEKIDFVKHAPKLKLSSELLQFYHGKKKNFPSGGNIIQLCFQIPLALAPNLYNVYGRSISFDDDRLTGHTQMDYAGSQSERQEVQVKKRRGILF